MAKKRKERVRQTRTDWQKLFDQHPGMLQPFGWSDRLPEVLHISIALIEHDYQVVKTDFHRIADFVNAQIKSNRKFHFNLTHTIKLIQQDKKILDEIFKTSFKSAFENLLPFYYDLVNIEIDHDFTPNVELLFIGYAQILDGRADISILSKYLMVQYEHIGRQDPTGIFNWNSKEKILEPMNVSTVMAVFPPSIGLSENMDLDFCHDIWQYNYSYSPLMPKPDDSIQEEKHFKEMKLEELTGEFNGLYDEFKELNLLAVYPPFIAEINIGFVARICNLSLDAIEFVKTHKGEIAELVFRTALETFIVASWLLKKQDVSLHKRFRDFSTGREKFFGEHILEKATSEKMKQGAREVIEDAIKAAGVRDIDVASERGDVFNVRIDQMADEIWGKDNRYYFLYKRSSEVTHGQWRVIAKYHLTRSLNPMHNGLYWYNENQNRFAGLIPAFICLSISVDFLLTILKDIPSEQTTELNAKLTDFRERLWKQYMIYFETYIRPDVSGANEQ